MEFRRCMPPCTRFIAREDPHSKCILCLGFSHAREAVYGTSNCKICDDFRLITLRSRLEDYERESSKFSRRASSTNAPPREIAASREAAASRRAASWGSDVELEEMESEQTGLAFSLPPSSERARANSPVEFLPDFQFPSPKARDFVSFGLDDILHTAASDSEDFGPALADALPPSSQEARPSAAYSELVDVLSRATEKLALDWPDEPRESRASKTAKAFLPAPNALSSLKSVTTTLRGLVCRSNSPSFHSGWQLGDAFVFPPLQPVHSPPASRILGDIAVSLLQCTEPVPATRQPSTSLSAIPSKDAEGFPSRWRVPLLPGLLDTPSQVCLPLHDTMIPLSHFLHEWERLPGVSLWVLRTIRTGYTLQFGKNPPRFDGVHLTVVNSAAKASVLQQELSSLLQKGAIEEVPQSEVERGFFSRYFLVPKRDGGLRPILDLRRLNLSLYKGKFKMLTMRTIMSQVQEGDWFVTIDLKDAYFHIQVVHRHRRFLRFAFGGKAYQYKVLPFGLALAPRTFTKCMDAALAPLRLQGIRVLNYLDDWLILAHSRELVSRHRDIVLGHIPFSWPQNERQEECAPPISTNCISRSSFGFRSDAGPFGSCPDTSFYSMFGPLQARPSCLCSYLPQAVGPYGSSLPCVAPRAASHEAIPLVDEAAEVTPHCTSYSPCQSVTQLLSTPVNVARPRLSPERGENGCDPPSPYDHDGRINDRLGRGLQRKAGEWRVEGRVPLLAYKLPGTQGCLPGFEVFSPRSRGASCHSQDGQYGGCVPHKPPRRFKVAHPGQACAPSSPLVSRQVPLFEGGSRSGSTEPGGRFSVETEAQAGGMDVEPSDGIPDLGSVWQSGGGPLCFSRVIPVPALVLPEFPDDSRHRCVRPPMAECQSVRVSANKADSGSTMQSEGERCPSPSHSPILALPDLVLGANSSLYRLLGRFRSGGTYSPSFRARSGILNRSSGSCGYGPYRAKGCNWWFACRSSGNHSQCQSPRYQEAILFQVGRLWIVVFDSCNRPS